MQYRCDNFKYVLVLPENDVILSSKRLARFLYPEMWK